MNRVISPLYAWGLIVVAAVVCAVLVFNDAKAYYADKTAQYNSEALASQLELKVIKLHHQGQIGTGLFIRGPQAK